MYIIANVTDRSGKIQKPERIGRTIYEVRFDIFSDGLRRMYGVYSGDFEGKMMVTSPVEMDTWDPESKDVTVVTLNSIYTFKHMEIAK